MTPLTSSIRYVWSLLSLVSELCKVCELSCHWSVSSTRYRYRYLNSPVLSLVSELYKVPVCELSCHWSVSSTRYGYVNSPVIGQWALQGTGMWTLLSLVSELYKLCEVVNSPVIGQHSAGYDTSHELYKLCELSCHWSVSSTRYKNSPIIGQHMAGYNTSHKLYKVCWFFSHQRMVGSNVTERYRYWFLLAALLFCFHQ